VEALILFTLGTVFAALATFQIRWTWRRVWSEDTYVGLAFLFIMEAVFFGICTVTLAFVPTLIMAARAWMVLPGGTLAMYSLELSGVLVRGSAVQRGRRSLFGVTRRSARKPRARRVPEMGNRGAIIIGAAAIGTTLGAVFLGWRGVASAVPAAVVTHATIGAWDARREQLRR